MSVFSLFCGPRKPSEDEEDSNAIEYLDSKSLSGTFDTLETDGTDEFSPRSFHNANFVVGDTPDTLLIEKESTMVDELVMREEGECRESVPGGEPSGSGLGLSPDLLLPDYADGPDMPKSGKDKRKVDISSPLSDASDRKISQSSSTVVCQGDDSEENDRGVTSDTVSMDKAVAEDQVDDFIKRDSNSENIPQNVVGKFGATTADVETGCLAPSTDIAGMTSSALKASSPGLKREEIPLPSVASNEQVHRNIDSNPKEEWHESKQDSDGDTNRFSSDAIEATDKDEPNEVDSNDRRKEPNGSGICVCSPATGGTIVSLVENESTQSKEFGAPAVDNVTPRTSDECQGFIKNDADIRASTGTTANPETSSDPEPADHTTMRDEDEETFSSELLTPMLDHNDGPPKQSDTRISSPSETVSGGESKSLGRLKSDETDETLSDSFEESSDKSVRFNDQVVIYSVPRIHSDDLDELFYTAMDISKFRQQKQKGVIPPSRPYDKAHCERLVEDLDRIGAESFVAGEYQKALGAFNHSLQVKTQIMSDCDNCSTAITIHCIADCYSKKGKWIQAMDAYNAALLVLEKADDSEEVRTSRVALEQKVQIMRRMLGLQRTPK